MQKLVTELHALLDKFNTEREDVRVHRTYWMIGAIHRIPEHAPPR